MSFLLLGVALLIALSFEFVNGFHDTANAVATVIYTNSLDPHVAVVWSGMWNLIGVLLSSGGVAFSVLALLPAELAPQMGRSAGFAMIFALLIAAILWNLGTWSVGLPLSSSHTLIGSILGVGLANQLILHGSGISGVNWAQVWSVFRALLVSPVVGFVFAALMLLLLKLVAKNKALYEAPKGKTPPPLWIRGLLVLTCTGVSFGHGSNDGQKGMGLIMLILIGTVPTAYSLNHAMSATQVADLAALSEQASHVLGRDVSGNAVIVDARADLAQYLRTKKYAPTTAASAGLLASDIAQEVGKYKSLANVPADKLTGVRNDISMESEVLRRIAKEKSSAFTASDAAILKSYNTQLDASIKFIPTWVKVVVALALGLGTMVGWKRIVVTVGERIGNRHLTYAQGASAEIVTAATILAATFYNAPVSTTHVLSSGVAGTMTANGSGLQWPTIRNIALAWVFTLPCAALLSGCIFWVFRQVIHWF